MPRSMQGRLLVSMAILIALPLLVITIVGGVVYARGIDEQATDYSAEMLEEVHTNIESYIHTVDQIIEYLSRDEAVIRFLRLKDSYDEARVQAETAARRQLWRFEEINASLISGMLIAGENELYASNELYRATRYPLTRDSWYQAAVAARGERILISHPMGRNLRTYRPVALNDIVTVARAVMDPDSGALLGVVCVDMLTDDIEARISNIKLGKSGYVFVQDAAGSIVYAPVNETVYRVNATQDQSIQIIHGERYQILKAHSDTTGWDTVGVFRMGVEIDAVRALRGYTLLLAAASVLLAIMVSMSFSVSFTRPIKQLARLMGDAETGNLDVRFEGRRAPVEIAALGQSFNSMIAKIRELLDLVVKQQREKRHAEIRTLQAQIKPHFLYNTLDTIRWMAEEKDAPEIGEMVGALTRLFRISLSRGREIIPLSEEAVHVQSYLYIQKVRYEDKLEYAIDIPESLHNMMVIKLILQPLVENAIYHGIKQKRGTGHIWVEARRQGDALRFTVKDDGAGMSQEACDRLNRELSDENALPESGYGIFNVNNRIRLSYGNSYGLHYAINELGGITVTMLCPATTELLPAEDAEGGEAP